MYSGVIGEFINNIQALRIYVESVETITFDPNIDLDQNEMMAYLMCIAKEIKMKNTNVEEFEFPEGIPLEVCTSIKKSIKELGNYLEISEDGTVGTYRSIPKDIKEHYIKLEAKQRQKEIIYSGSLIILITYFENMIAKLLRCDFRKHPNRMSLENKTVTYKMLEISESIEDVKNYLIEEEVISLMYKSVSDWIEYLKKKIKLRLEYASDSLPILNEIMARRNLIVHNEGKVNSIYINIVSKDNNSFKIGDVLSVDKEYLNNTINTLELVGVSIIVEMWINEAGKKKDEIDKILSIIFEEYLIFEKWEQAKILYEICLDSKKMRAADELLCKINRWQCYKWLDQYDKISSELDEIDLSGSNPKYILGVLALQDKFEYFFQFLSKQNEIGEDELKEWPLFRKIRESKEYFEFLKTKNT
ncbi:MAG: hypothetical protein HFI34_06980 [Lachnospiraceae bacterium]|nr:hypothetical protein [Lachnospiraceae bacterium]